MLDDVCPQNRSYLIVDGRQAKEAFAAGRPRLVLLDLVYVEEGEKLNGRRFLHWVRNASERPLTPVVIYSGAHSPEIVADLYREGANGFLPKVFVRDPKERLRRFCQHWLEDLELPVWPSPK